MWPDDLVVSQDFTNCASDSENRPQKLRLCFMGTGPFWRRLGCQGNWGTFPFSFHHILAFHPRLQDGRDFWLLKYLLCLLPTLSLLLTICPQTWLFITNYQNFRLYIIESLNFTMVIVVKEAFLFEKCPFLCWYRIVFFLESCMCRANGMSSCCLTSQKNIIGTLSPSLWRSTGSQPVGSGAGGPDEPFTGVVYQILTLQFLTIVKLKLRSSNKIIL